MKHYVLSAAIAVTTLGLGLGACNSSTRTADGAHAPGVSIEPSAREVVAGDTVTFVARSHDTYGRDTKIRWEATSGSVTTDQDGRVARVKFSNSGTYSVKAVLVQDGRDVQSDIVEVRVKPVG
ncbi:MAG: PKD domain-containing protein [Phycisphaerales bacterium]|jgi:plastocyanin